jgi:hypothetical protein
LDFGILFKFYWEEFKVCNLQEKSFSWTGFITPSDKKKHVIPACFLAEIQEITKTAISAANNHA